MRGKNLPSVVGLVGGSGGNRLMIGLRRHPVRPVAICTVCDSGGSTGRLREEMKDEIMAMGDMRNCMEALMPEDKPFLRRILGHEIEGDGAEVSRHKMGNIQILAAEQIAKKEAILSYDPVEGIIQMNRELGLVGDVLPASRQSAHLIAHYDDDSKEVGESNLDLHRPEQTRVLTHITLDRRLEICPQAQRAILNAKLLVLGPGDTHASIASILKVDGVQEAIRKSPAKLAVPINLMTKYSETRDYTASRFVDELFDYGIGRDKIDVLLVNVASIPREVRQTYWEKEKAVPVLVDRDELKKRRIDVVLAGNLLSSADLLRERPRVRHDPIELGNQLVRLIGIR